MVQAGEAPWYTTIVSWKTRRIDMAKKTVLPNFESDDHLLPDSYVLPDGNFGGTICTRCQREEARPDQELCDLCLRDIEEDEKEREARERQCVICENKKLPDSVYCQDCDDWVKKEQEHQFQQEQEALKLCILCKDNEHLPDSNLCQECEDYLMHWEKNQWKDIWRSFLRSLIEQRARSGG